MFNQIQLSDKDIHEDHSLTAEEFLLSPSYNKFKSPDQFDHMKENSLAEYIYPMEIMNKTENKAKTKRFRQVTEPDFDRVSNKSKISRHSNIENIVLDLQTAIKKKDAKIKELEKSLSELASYSKNGKTQITAVTIESPHFDKDLLYTLRDKKESPKKETSNLGNNHIMMEFQLQKYEKEIKFLTSNNKELYEELITMGEYCEKIKQTLSKTIQYTHELEEKLSEASNKNNGLSSLNKTLLKEKKQMMRNYEEELIIFEKMKKVCTEKKKESKSKEKVKINQYLQKYANQKEK